MDIIEYFIGNPEKSFHVRELARLTDKSPSTVSNKLKEYEKKGILSSRREFNHLFFRANTESAQYKSLKRHHNLSNLHEPIEFLAKTYNHPEAIILFGSYARAEDIPRSDIDIAVITPINIRISLERFEKKLGHKIQLFEFSSKEIENLSKNDKELLNSLVNGIVIHGFWEVFR